MVIEVVTVAQAQVEEEHGQRGNLLPTSYTDISWYRCRRYTAASSIRKRKEEAETFHIRNENYRQ